MGEVCLQKLGGIVYKKDKAHIRQYIVFDEWIKYRTVTQEKEKIMG